MKSKKRVRKPRKLALHNDLFGGTDAYVVPGYQHAEVRADILYWEQAHILAKWLLRYAKWAKQKEKRK